MKLRAAVDFVFAANRLHGQKKNTNGYVNQSRRLGEDPAGGSEVGGWVGGCD